MDLNGLIDQLAGNSMGARVLIAIALVVILAVLIHLAVRALKRIMRKREEMPEVTFFVNLLRATLWVIGGSIILDVCFDVNVTALIAALGIGGIALSLGLKDTLSNLFGGAQVIALGLVKPGDYIKVGAYSGTVQDVTWRQTTIKNRYEEEVVIPNSIMTATEVVKMPNPKRPTIWFVATRYIDPDTLNAQLCAAADEAAASVATIVEPAQVFFDGFEGMGMKGRVLITVGENDDTNAVVDAISRAIAPLIRSEAESE